MGLFGKRDPSYQKNKAGKYQLHVTDKTTKADVLSWANWVGSQGVAKPDVYRYLRVACDQVARAGAEVPVAVRQAVTNALFDYEAVLLVEESLGGEFEHAGKVPEAIEVYERCLAGDWPFPLPYKRLLVLYRQAHEYDKALRVAKQASRIVGIVKGLSDPGTIEKLVTLKLKLKASPK
jgi:hypothetical protein